MNSRALTAMFVCHLSVGSIMQLVARSCMVVKIFNCILYCCVLPSTCVCTSAAPLEPLPCRDHLPSRYRPNGAESDVKPQPNKCVTLDAVDVTG